MSEEILAWGLTGLALACVTVPFFRAFLLCARAWSATRRVNPNVLRKGVGDARAGEVQPFAMLMMRILRKSLREEEHATDFVFDATRQYVMNEYDANYARIVTMYASILPPIGFIGTTAGMLVLFLSMHFADASLELGALAVALSSSIFALMGYAVLEGLKIRLYGRLLACLRDVQILFEEADARRQKVSTLPGGDAQSA